MKRDGRLGAVFLAVSGLLLAAPPVLSAQQLLNQQTLAQHLDSLRTKPVRSFVVSGAVVLDETVGPTESWFVQDLTFQDGSAFYLGSKSLTLNIRGTLTVPDGTQIIFGSFPSGLVMAPDGGPGPDGGTGQNGSGDGADGAAGGQGAQGNAGADGSPGGRLNLVLGRMPTGPFKVRLVGQNGGNGGFGGRGGRGGDGQRGSVADSGVWGCNRGGGDGGRGGNGGRGGDGGRGGICGAGGELMIFATEAVVDDLSQILIFDRALASPGSSGEPGVGGPPGHGGLMGNGNGFCGGGHGGPDGGPGSSGIKPAPPDSTSCTEPQLRFLPIAIGN